MTTQDEPLRLRIERLIRSLSVPSPPQEAISDAALVLGGLRGAARKMAANTFRGVDEAIREVEEEYGPDAPDVLGFVDDLIGNSDDLQVEPRRIEIAKSISDVATAARLRGLWEEHILLRSVAWIMVEPTGIAIAALRQQMFSDPVTVPLLSEFVGSGCGPIGAATDLAMLLRNLARAANPQQPTTN